MTDSEIREHIERVIKHSFEIIKKVYAYQREDKGFSGINAGSRIIFPLKANDANDKVRVSEQELRFVFVEQLNKEIKDTGWEAYYSVETPTKDKYTFSNGTPRVDKNGRSANFDLVIFDGTFKRRALIEFKANNPEPRDYKKDFVKLDNHNEDGSLRYFIQLIKRSDKGTIKSISNKICNKEIYYCCCLEEL